MKQSELGQYIVENWQADNLDRDQWLRDQPRWMKAYQGRVEQKNLPWEGASNLNVPVDPTVIDALHPRLMAAIFRPDPIVSLRPQEPGDAERARRRERFLDWALREEINAFPVMDRLILSMLIHGVGFLKIAWDLKVRHLRDKHTFPLDTPLDQAVSAIYQTDLQLVEAVQRTSDLTIGAIVRGRKVKVEVESHPTSLVLYTERDEVIRDAPLFQVINAEDITVNSDAPMDCQEAHHVFHRYWLTIDQVRRKIRQGIFQATDKELDELEDSLSSTQGSPDETERMKETREEISGSRELYREGEPERIELIDAYVPWDINDDGYDEEVIVTIPIDKPNLELRKKRLEEVYRHGMRPFVPFGLFPVGNSLWCMGVPQILDGLQTEFNVIHNQRADAGQLSNTPYGWYVPGAGYQPEKIPIEPGFMHPVDDINSVKMAEPSNWTAWGFQEEALLWDLVERRTKVSDLTLGRVSESQGVARTATGVQQLSAQQAMGFDILIRRVQESFRQVLKQTQGLYQQYMPAGKEQRIAGKMGEPDLVVSRQDLIGNMDMVFSGNALSTDRDIERQSLTFLSQQALSPQVLGFLLQMGITTPVGIAAWYQHLLTAFDVANRDKIIQIPSEEDILSVNDIVNRTIGGERLDPQMGEQHMKVVAKFQKILQSPQALILSAEQQMVIAEQVQRRMLALQQEQLLMMQMQMMMGGQAGMGPQAQTPPMGGMSPMGGTPPGPGMAQPAMGAPMPRALMGGVPGAPPG